MERRGALIVCGYRGRRLRRWLALSEKPISYRRQADGDSGNDKDEGGLFHQFIIAVGGAGRIGNITSFLLARLAYYAVIKGK